jgi:glyoxylase-like metal-dependent hydrolase (beta-lactamase superfamily II)
MRNTVRRSALPTPRELSHLRCRSYYVTVPSIRSNAKQDPRQYVPASGQSWTSLKKEQELQKNTFETDTQDSRIHYITTKPLTPAELPPGLADSSNTWKQLGIGQRAILLQTAHGNVLWDLVAFLNPSTIEFINSKGGLKAIVISHPHFYTTHLEWAKVFNCPVYMSTDDAEWLNREDREGMRKPVSGVTDIEEVGGEVKMIQCGGHFDGSSVALWEKKLFIADTFMSVPVSLPHPSPPSPYTPLSSQLTKTVRHQKRLPHPRHNHLLLHVGVP